ncbi:lysozyme inhibitor LprI family protein [Burkholderia sp. SRS-W-2-2016]|uniref:lysozyme inhibitor LprI family protein n=1 Tax=Burkholderia sp. SRS-W-2-2016 TaxID=1926878 RepID=UPI0009FAD2C6|nr:lysozyme inhibitor LprI family protein [Burkholderia sp. SRS-W-2-2016]
MRQAKFLAGGPASWRRGAGVLALALAAGGALLTGAWPSAARAEVAAADPIDASMRACLARSDMSTTMGQVQCMDNARIAWKAAADSAFQQLESKLPPARRRLWQKGQASWLAWRDAEKPLLAAVFATTQGSMYVLAEADMQLQPVRDRALVLRSALAAASGPAPRRPRACNADARCEHAMFDLNRYYRVLNTKMPAPARPALGRAQRAWRAYLDASTPLVDEHGRIDIIGARVATVKRLSETVGNH